MRSSRLYLNNTYCFSCVYQQLKIFKITRKVIKIVTICIVFCGIPTTVELSITFTTYIAHDKHFARASFICIIQCIVNIYIMSYNRILSNVHKYKAKLCDNLDNGKSWC